MANSIMQQVLENVQGGTTLPAAQNHDHPPASHDSISQEQVDRIAAGVLARIDAELEQLLVRIVSHPVVRRIARRGDAARRDLVTRVEVLLRSELGQIGNEFAPPAALTDTHGAASAVSATRPAPAPSAFITTPSAQSEPDAWFPSPLAPDAALSEPNPLASSDPLPAGITKVLADLADRAAGGVSLETSGSG